MALLAAALPNAAAQEGGIEVFAAETLFASGTRVSLSHIYRERDTLFNGTDEIPDPFDRTFSDHRLVLGVDRGVRPDLTLSALFPLVDRGLDSNLGDVDGTGAGDLALLAKYRLFKRDWRRGAYHLAALAGLELPTGRTGVRDGDVALPPGVQPGSGAWSPFVGLATNIDLNRFRFDALAFYKANTEGAQDFERGDFFSFELDAAYRFLHTKYPGATASARVGLQWRHQSHSEQAGVRIDDSGSDELYFRPGLTWHPAPNLDLTVAVDIPLHQDFNGDQLGLDTRTFLAFGVRF